MKNPMTIMSGSLDCREIMHDINANEVKDEYMQFKSFNFVSIELDRW